jgi:hypothetical protein
LHFREAEVEQLDPLPRHQNVCRLEIAVYDAVPVRVMFLRDRYKRCWGKNAPPILKPVDTALRAVA